MHEEKRKLPLHFYQSEDVISIAKSLLGKQISTNINGNVTAGIIVETEAYMGITDKASHAYNGRFTNRTKTMFEDGGITYVYLCYGIHSLLNVITGPKDTPHAVLIRAIEPTTGIDIMLQRRNMTVLKSNITKGPGALSQALGVDRDINAMDLNGDIIWIEDVSYPLNKKQIVACPRIGIDYAGEDALLPWRFYIRDNIYVSRPVKGL
ncbi:DNA-3-methyladenine glycosylase [Taibaiella lutea]|uniref:Putative 3-methyladenine DNA glycosylase n=1 Tax=Taibaiella lutea TaxID=2608001 RepID=A0A5M6CAK0_9BACT|nr:DNA-3-methyladenine glycosylase [Taibaiella lutea]KAA5532154.1 DNA-3-methyladenine glycosylase [Taibaiella lutea]